MPSQAHKFLVNLLDAMQVVPGKQATALPDCFDLPFQYFDENRGNKTGSLAKSNMSVSVLAFVEGVLFFTQQCQLQTQKTSHRTFDVEILMTMPMPNMDKI